MHLDAALKAPWRARRVCGLLPFSRGVGGGSSELKSEPSPLSDPAVPNALGEEERQGSPPRSGPPSQVPLPRDQLLGGGRLGDRLVDSGSGRLSPHLVPEVGGAGGGPTPAPRVPGRQSGRARSGLWREGPGEETSKLSQSSLQTGGAGGAASGQLGPDWRGWRLHGAVPRAQAMGSGRGGLEPGCWRPAHRSVTRFLLLTRAPGSLPRPPSRGWREGQRCQGREDTAWAPALIRCYLLF